MSKLTRKKVASIATPDSGYASTYVNLSDQLILKKDTGAEEVVGGETNTASNVGAAGVGVFKQKTGVDLEFKKINAGSNKVTITDDTGNNEIDIDVDLANIFPTTAKGDIIVYNGTTNVRLPVGTNGYALKANSGTATGLEWAADGGGITALTGDVTASGSGSVAATVVQVGGIAAASVASGANLALAATDANTFSTIVKRGAAGEISIGKLFVNQASPLSTSSVEIKLPATENIFIDAATNNRTLTRGVFRIEHTPGASSPGTRAIHLQINAGAVSDTHSVFTDYRVGTGFTGMKEAHTNELVIDTGASTGGEVVGYAVSKLGTGSVSVVGAEYYPGVIPFEQKVGTAVNPGYVFTTASGVAPFVDVTANFISAASDVQVWTTNNSYVDIGYPTAFNIIALYWQTPADGDGIKPEFLYSTDQDGLTWVSMSPSDGTNGARNNGLITFSDSALTGWTSIDNGSGIAQRWIRIKRTNASLVTAPTEDYCKLYSTTTYKLDSTGALNLATLRTSGKAIIGGSTVPTNYQFQVTGSVAGASVVQAGVYSTAAISGAGPYTGTKYGARFQVATDHQSSHTTGLVGVEGVAEPGDQSPNGPVTGVQGQVILTSWDASGSSDVATFRAKAITGSISPTNAYGFYGEAVTIGTNSWAIFTAGGVTQHNTGAAANKALILKGFTSQSANLFELQDSAATIIGGASSAGHVGAGAAPSASTALNLKASTTALSSARFPQGTSPTSPVEGDTWNDSTQKCIVSFVDGVKQYASSTLFVQTQTITVVNTITETSLVGTGIGTATLPANFWTVGKTLRFKARGYLSSNNGQTARWRIKYGSVVLLDTGVATETNHANNMWMLDGEVTCRTTGATGTVMGQGVVSAPKSAVDDTPHYHQMTNLSTVTIDTTASTALAATIEWGTADVGNSFTITNLTVEVVN